MWNFKNAVALWYVWHDFFYLKGMIQLFWVMLRLYTANRMSVSIILSSFLINHTFVCVFAS